MSAGRNKPSLRVEFVLFFGLGIFFIPVAAIYMWLADFEPVGSTAFVLLPFLAFIVAGYLYLLSQRISARPEDVPDGEISEATGEVGVFSPTSWWPLVAGVATAIAFVAASIGFWLLIPAGVLGLIGMTGMVMEFSFGPHQH